MSQAMTKLKDAGMLTCLGTAGRKAVGLVGSQYDVLRHWTDTTEVPKTGPADLIQNWTPDMTCCCQDREPELDSRTPAQPQGLLWDPESANGSTRWWWWRVSDAVFETFSFPPE